jgi:hypothetical protein
MQSDFRLKEVVQRRSGRSCMQMVSKYITLINKFWIFECYGYVNTLSLCFLGRRLRK